MFTNDIVGSSVGGTGIATRTRCASSPRACRPTRRPPRRTRVARSAARTTRPPRQLARFVKEVADNGHTNMQVKIIYRRDRFGAAATTSPFLEQGFRSSARFTELNEDFDHQHQNVRVENGEQIGDLPEFVDFDYVARVAKVNAATLAALADAPGAPKDVRIAERPELRHVAPLDGEPGARSRRLRGRLARDDRSRLDAVDLGRQRHLVRCREHVEGQLLLRRARRRYRGEPQPGRLPAAVAARAPSKVEGRPSRAPLLRAVATSRTRS